ncbi:MAG: DUF3545 family protein [Alteromonadaceae bacterium]|nr:DUF3545 family protein [Alteromonadaceae bacterium]
MDTLQEVSSLTSKAKKSNVSSNKKRKWREIEQLKEKFQLERDLKIYENSLEYMLEDF